MNQCKICNGIKGVHGNVLPGCTCAQSYTPNQQNKQWEWKQPVMTLRDYFAGQALMGIVARSAWDPRSDAAESAYEYADAMLAARGVKP